MGALHLLVNASDFDCQFEARMAGVLRALDTLLTVMRPTTWGFRLFDGRAMVGRSPRELVGCRGASFGPRNDEEAICSLADHVRRALRSLRQHAPAPLAAARGGDVSSHGILMRALMEVLGQVRSESEVIELDDDARADAAALVVVVAASPPNESALAQFVFKGKPPVNASSRDPVAALDTVAESWQRLARRAPADGADVAPGAVPRVLWLDVLGENNGEQGIADRLANAMRGDGAAALVPACTVSCAAHLLSTGGLAHAIGLAQAPVHPPARPWLRGAPSIAISAPDSAAALCVAEPLELPCNGEHTHAWLLGIAPLAALPVAWLAPRGIYLARAPRDGGGFAALSTGLVRQREAALVSLGHHAPSPRTGEHPGAERPEMAVGVLIAIDAATAVMYTHRIEVKHVGNDTRTAAWQAFRAAVPQGRAASAAAVDAGVDTSVSLHEWLQYEAALQEATYGNASSSCVACSHTADDEQRPHSMFDYFLSLVLEKDCDTDAGGAEHNGDADLPVRLDAHACALLCANGLPEVDDTGAGCNTVVSREMLRSLKRERRARMPIPTRAPVHQSVTDLGDGAPEGEAAATASVDTTIAEAVEAAAQPETPSTTLDDCEAIQQMVASVNASVEEAARAGDATASTEATCTELSRLYDDSVATGLPSPLALACCVMPRVCDHSAGSADEGDTARTGNLRGILEAVRKRLLRTPADLRDRHAPQASECGPEEGAAPMAIALPEGRKRREYSLQVLLRLQLAALLAHHGADVTSAPDPLPDKQMKVIIKLLEALLLVLDAPAPAAVPGVTASCETVATHSEGREASSSCGFLEHALAARFLSTLPHTVKAIYVAIERDAPSLVVAGSRVTGETASNDDEKVTSADEMDGMPDDRTQRAGGQRHKRLLQGGSVALPAPRITEAAPPAKRPCTESSSTRSKPRAGLTRTLSVPAPNARHVAALGTMQRARNQNVVVNKSATVAQQDNACCLAAPRGASAKIQARAHNSSPLRRSPRRLGRQGTVPAAPADSGARRTPGLSALAARTVSAPMMPCMSSPGADWRGKGVGRAGAQRLVRSQSGAASQQAPRRTIIGETPSKAAR